MSAAFPDISCKAVRELDPPGAGLPAVEGWLLRWVVFPVGNIRLSWAGAGKQFRVEGERILKLGRSLEKKDFVGRVMIGRIRGIEDSSRFWSVEMVMEHLMITGDLMGRIIRALASGQRCREKVDIADVKPRGSRGTARLTDYADFLDRFDADTRRFGEMNLRGPRHNHPWLGELNAKQWRVLSAMHQRLHRKQVEAIVQQLASPGNGKISTHRLPPESSRIVFSNKTDRRVANQHTKGEIS